MLTRFLHRALAFLAFAIIYSASPFAAAEEEVIDIDIPAGKASVTLKKLIALTELQIIYRPNELSEFRTRAARGKLTPREALDRMLGDIPFKAVQDSESGAFAIIRVPYDTKRPSRRGGTRELQSLDTQPEMNSKPTNENPKTFLKALLSLAIASSPYYASAQELDENDVYTLSPFSVDASEDTGYRATSTLAGTRIKTNLADVGASITAITEQFMEDTGSTNLNELLVYTANTETATVGGNFSAGFEQSDAFGRGFQSGQTSIINPQGAQRLRGLSSADVTRNLFRSSITWDNYNVDRVEIVRGANSILFGQGSPAGTINVNLIKPFFRDAHEVKIRFDDQGSLRSSFDSNVIALKDKVAIRVAGLQDNFNFRQNPAFEDDERLFGALTWNITENLTLRLNGEVGRIRANRANPFGPTDGFSDYLGHVGAATYPVVGADEPRIPELLGGTNILPAGTPRIFVQYGLNLEADGSLAGSSPSTNTVRWAFSGNNVLPDNPEGIPVAGRTVRASRANYELRRGIGLLPTSLEDYSIFDWKNNSLAGNFPFQDQDFQTSQAVLEYISKEGRFGVELAFDHQTEDRETQRGPVTSRDYVIRLDVSQQTFDGTPNPNALRPVTVFTQNIQGTATSTQVNEAVQLNAFAKLNVSEDLNMDNWLGRLLGRHTFTLYASDAENRFDGLNFDETWVGENIANNASNGLSVNRPFGHNHRDVGAAIYLGPAVSSIDDISITPIGFSARDYFPNGETYTVRVWDKASQTFRDIPMQSVHNISGASDVDTTTETLAAILQSNWLDDHIVTTLGYREDDLSNSRKVFGTAPGTANMVDPNIFTIDEVGGTGDYFSWSVVAKSPRGWELPGNTRFSLFYSESENFDPSATGRIDSLARPIAAPTGVTEDYGLRINTLNDKLELKVNFFETGLTGQSFTGGLTGIAITELDIRFRELTFVRGVDAGYLDPNDPVLQSFGTPPQAILDERNAVLNEEGIYEFSGQGRITDTTDTAAEGMEIEALFSPTPQWRVMLNLSRQETARTNSLQGIQDYIALRLPSWQTAFDYPSGAVSDERLAEPGIVDENGILDTAAFAAAFPDSTREADFNTRLRIPLQAILDTDGGVVDEQREWRFNVVTNYTFGEESRMTGFNVGGAVRWQDVNAIGNPFTTNADGQTIVDINNPFFGPDQTNVDAWIGYRRLFANDRVDWKIQLNARNLFSDDDPVPVTIDAFGNNSQYILPPLTTWSVTNTFRF